MNENETARELVEAFKVQNTIGLGLLKPTYESVLTYELRMRGYAVAEQYAVPAFYEEFIIHLAFRADMISDEINNWSKAFYLIAP